MDPSLQTQTSSINPGSASTIQPMAARATLPENHRLIIKNVVLPFEDIGLGKRP